MIDINKLIKELEWKEKQIDVLVDILDYVVDNKATPYSILLEIRKKLQPIEAEMQLKDMGGMKK
jgi:hypothetical protein